MKPLSRYLNEDLVNDLRLEIGRARLPGISFELAMQFLLTDGVLPASGLPVASFLKLEDWVRSRSDGLSYSATELKNKTGEIIEQVLKGRTVRIVKHGRPIAEIKKLTG